VQIAKVIGSIVSTVKHNSYNGYKLMIVQPLTTDLKPKGNITVAIDNVQSGEGDLVLLLSEGNSARQILNQNEAPIRAVIVGIIDKVDYE